MPNKKGGKKFKKGKKQSFSTQRKLIFKNEAEGVEDQEYAKVLKVNGSGRFQVLCFDGVERMATLCGQMRKRVWVNLNDIILVSLWTDIQDNKCTIIHKYDTDEAYKLKDLGEFPSQIRIEEDEGIPGDDALYFTNNIPKDEDSEEEHTTDYFENAKLGETGVSKIAEDFDLDFDDILGI